jgi:hypothetical protein
VDALHHVAVKRHRHVGADIVDAAHEPGDRAGLDRPARVLALGAVGDKKVLPAPQAGLGEDRQHLIAGGAGVRRRLQHDQLPAAQDSGDHAGTLQDVAQVGFAVRAQRRGDAQQDRVGVREALGADGGLEPIGGGQLLGQLVAQVVDVRLAALELVDLGRVGVVADDAVADVVHGPNQREPHVAQADHGYGRGLVVKTPAKLRRGRGGIG